MRSLLVVLAWLASAASVRAQDSPTIALGGDVIYDGPLVYQLRQRSPEIGRAAAYREVFEDLSPALSTADLAVVNLEVPISPRYREQSEGESPVFRAPDDFLDALRDAGVDAVTVANNHAYDQGVRGLRNTLRAIEDRELRAIGAGDDLEHAARAIIVPVGEVRVAIAAWTEGSNYRPSVQEGTAPCVALLRAGAIAPSLRAARAQAHLVIASFHWTQEGEVDPHPHMRAAAREAAEAGADLVYGHGTHLPGRTETIVTSDGRRVPVLYSLGNLLAAMEEPAGTLASREVGVRDAPLAIVSTRWEGERLVVADVALRHHFIARPTEAPIEGTGIFRPVALEHAMSLLASRSDCEPCARQLVLYRRRDALVRDAMRAMSAPPARMRPQPIVQRATMNGGSPNARPARVVRTAGPSTIAPPVAVRSDAHIPDGDPRLAPLLRGVAVAVEFREGSAIERTVDAGLIARVAALMREDRSLRAETIAHGELAMIRARRVNGLIAVRGPSRSRFTARVGTGEGRVVIRLYR